jgi:hypothetical protein
MADYAERTAQSRSKRGTPMPARSGPRHESLQRRAADREAGYAAHYAALLSARPAGAQPVQRAALNRTGLPDRLKGGIEALSGISMEGVKVHYNSPEPGRLQAHAYTQGVDIHVAPGQERHLPHEAWHALQQKQGRVRATQQLKGGLPLNDDAGLEREADLMGAKAAGLDHSAAAPARLSPRPVAGASAAVQRVGGQKFGLERTGGATDIVNQGIAALKRVQAAYKAAVKLAKDTATQQFEAGDKGNIARQTQYTQALAAAEMSPEGLLGKLATEPGLTHAGDVISFQGTEIAQIKRGADSYTVSAQATHDTAAIYKRHTLDGPSDKEFVDVGGAKLRRYAYRGITPEERAAYKSNAPLKPDKADKASAAKKRSHDPSGVAKKTKPKESDLTWLKNKSGMALPQVPNDPEVQSFLQIRKGVGKFLSATSTAKQIASNQGEAFTGFGNVKIDLAKVPAANIMHHYKRAPFASADLMTKLGNPHDGARLTNEAQRGNESVTRNRELVMTQIPRAAVASLTESPARITYEQAFKARYDVHYCAGYGEAVLAANLNFAPQDPAALAAWPWSEDHFTASQGTDDANAKEAVGKQAGTQAATGRIAFGTGYAQAYVQYYRQSYAAAAREAPSVQSRPDKDSLNIPVPNPAVGLVPVGEGAPAGAQSGQAAGEQAGALAGAAFTP